jgi:hypothetical protein
MAAAVFGMAAYIGAGHRRTGFVLTLYWPGIGMLAVLLLVVNARGVPADLPPSYEVLAALG